MKSPNTFIVCGHMRSGSTLIKKLVAAILKEKYEVNNIDFIEEWEPFLHKIRTGCKNVIKVHHCNDELESLVKSGDAIAIYSYRDPRDTVVSAMRMFNLTPREAGLALKYNLRDHGNRWENLPGVIILKYEEISKNIPILVTTLSKQLGADLNQQQINLIADSHSREAIKKSRTLAPNHVGDPDRSSAVKVLDKARISRIEEILSSWMEDHGYEKLYYKINK